MSQVDAAGNWVNATTDVKEVKKTCKNKTITPGTVQCKSLLVKLKSVES